MNKHNTEALNNARENTTKVTQTDSRDGNVSLQLRDLQKFHKVQELSEGQLKERTEIHRKSKVRPRAQNYKIKSKIEQSNDALTLSRRCRLGFNNIQHQQRRKRNHKQLRIELGRQINLCVFNNSQWEF